MVLLTARRRSTRCGRWREHGVSCSVDRFDDEHVVRSHAVDRALARDDRGLHQRVAADLEGLAETLAGQYRHAPAAKLVRLRRLGLRPDRRQAEAVDMPL